MSIERSTSSTEIETQRSFNRRSGELHFINGVFALGSMTVSSFFGFLTVASAYEGRPTELVFSSALAIGAGFAGDHFLDRSIEERSQAERSAAVIEALEA